MFKKIISIFLAVICSALSALTVFAEAESEPKIIQGELKRISIDRSTPKNNFSLISIPENASYPFITAQTYGSYQLMNETEKTIYDYFVNSPLGTTECYLNVSMSYDEFINIDFQKIMYALAYDCPEIFYLPNTARSGAASGIDMNRNGVLDKGDTVTLIALLYDDIDVNVFPNLNATNSQLWSKVNSLDFSACKNRYELVKAFHDTLCQTADYDTNFDNDRAYNVIGCFLDGDCVCEGYSESFKLLCNLYGIPSVCLAGKASGENHEWNAVLMDDGKWYLLDVTWDDQYIILYDYFLSGTETVDTHFKRVKFSSSHALEYDAATPHIPFSETAYVQTDANRYTRFDATHDCFEDDALKTVFRTINDTDEPVYFNGLRITEADKVYKTGDTIAAKSGENFTEETWNLFYAGDPNEDLQCDAADYALFVNKALAYDGTFDEAGYSFDMNFDRSIDVLDVVLAERISNGYDI